MVYYEWYEPSYQRALKTAQRQGLRQGGEAGVKQAMRQGCVTPLTPGATGPASTAAASWEVFGADFGGWAAWTTGVTKSDLNGPVAVGVKRTNETSVGVLMQVLTRFDEETRSLTVRP